MFTFFPGKQYTFYVCKQTWSSFPVETKFNELEKGRCLNLFRWLNYFSTALLGSNPESQIQSKIKILNSPNFKSADEDKFADNPIRSPQISGSSSYWLKRNLALIYQDSSKLKLQIKPVLKDTWLNYFFAAIH